MTIEYYDYKIFRDCLENLVLLNHLSLLLNRFWSLAGIIDLLPRRDRTFPKNR